MPSAPASARCVCSASSFRAVRTSWGLSRAYVSTLAILNEIVQLAINASCLEDVPVTQETVMPSAPASARCVCSGASFRAVRTSWGLSSLHDSPLVMPNHIGT